jgi:glutathione S-transferase
MMDAADFLRVSPGKKIPAFQHGDLMLTESAAISRYLMDNFSGQEWSVAERARMDRVIFFVLMELDATALYVIRRHEGLPAIYGNAPTAVAAAYAYADRQFAVLSDLLDDHAYCLGERFSEADIHVGSILDWALSLEIDLPANLSRYHDRLRARAAYQAASEANASAML